VHLAYDALISLGVVITGILILFLHWTWLDPLVALLIAITIFMGSWRLLKQSVDLILDAVPAHVKREDIESFLLAQPNVVALHDLHIWGLSTKDTALTTHLIVSTNNLNNSQIQQISDGLAARFNIKHSTIQLEHSDEATCSRIDACQ
jgi:cobalt-zinc-cadmium efflux system protein